MQTKFKILLFVSAIITSLASCGINDLEDRIEKLETTIGSNEPLTVDFNTTDAQNRDITLKRDFNYKPVGGFNTYIQFYTPNILEVYVERFSDSNWSEGAWIAFTYNTETKEVSNAGANIYFINRYGYWLRPNFYDNEDVSNGELKVNAVDLQKGFVDVEFSASTTSESFNNVYQGKPMIAKFRFKGTVDVYDLTDSNN